MWKVKYEKRVQKDLDKLKEANLDKNARKIVDLLQKDPYKPTFKKLVGDFAGYYSRRINIKHRVVYRLEEEEKAVVIISMWGHYDD